MQRFIDILKEKNLLKIITEPLDINLEIPHVAYAEAKKEHPKALLFTHPKDGDKSFDMPVVMNLFGSHALTHALVGDAQKIAAAIESYLKQKPPKTLKDKLKTLLKFSKIKNTIPKYLKTGLEKTHKLYRGRLASLDLLPILTTWEKDGGPFITMGQVYTQSLDGEIKNVGMYRLQKYNDKELGLHWQIHKDSKHFFDEYKKANKRMPVSIAIGGDPLYTWCGTAPMPYGMFELMLYGFIKEKPVKLVRSHTNPIYVPHDCDIVIEGWVDPKRMEQEGPFGDHTGYYTPIEPYPVLEVESIAIKEKAHYVATVVGKPPLEDKYMGYLTERIFLPLLQTSAHSLIDYHMPENGVFHNLILAKVRTSYPGEAKQVMHSLWGAGQMSFVKHALFVDKEAPNLTEHDKLVDYILERFSVKSIIVSEGVCDALDHASPDYAYGGKLAIDCTEKPESITEYKSIGDELLLEKFKSISSDFITLKQFKPKSNNPITVVTMEKTKPVSEYLEAFKALTPFTKIVALIDCQNNSLDYPYMLLWRVVNNIDAQKDIHIVNDTVFIDATAKGALENFPREWPDDVLCTPSVLDKLIEKNVIDLSDEERVKYGLTEFSCTGSASNSDNSGSGDFYEQCYEVLRQVPKGHVTTYQEIAHALGSKAYRAVGSAMAKNTDIPNTPCHRVVKSDGSIGNYALGADKKIAILKEEEVEVQNGKVVDFEKVLFRF